MFRTSIIFCLVSAALSIIVTDPPPLETDYKYSYNIEDPTTGDTKSQHEVRQGDVVSGAYSVVGPDGNKRTVEYTADSKHGFQAVLKEEPVQVSTKSPYYLPPRVQIPQISSIPQYPAYTLKLRDPYVKDNQNIVFFTPGNENEIQSDRLVLEHGKFFEPGAK